MSSRKQTAPSTSENPLVKSYLIFYNVVEFFGWSYILLSTILHFLRGGDITGVYEVVAIPLYLFQSSAVLEIVHASTGLVRSAVFTTFVQVLSRVFVIWGVLSFEFEPVIRSAFVTSLVIAWSLSEVIRYSFYALKQIDACPAWLTYVRYSGFLVLYPVGICSELALVLLARPFFAADRSIASIMMPNSFNMSFDYLTLVYVAIALYAPGSPLMISTMMAQRRKELAKLRAAALPVVPEGEAKKDN